MNEHYERSEHRTDATSFDSVQSGNKKWWTNHTMSYDWEAAINAEAYSLRWFEEVDRRFVESAKIYSQMNSPFDRFIPFEQLKGKSVLEIGCGMGFHTELLVRAGANVTSIDISPTSVGATRRRLELKGLQARVIEADAEMLPFADNEFSFVWSWGVIHHSSRTARIVKHIGRVLEPAGNCCVMVYNRDGAAALRAFVKYHLLKMGFFRGKSLDEALNKNTDGFHARHYTRDQFEDLFRAFFDKVSCEVCGQIADALPLPRRIRGIAKLFVSEAWLKRKQAQRGNFLVLKASKPCE